MPKKATTTGPTIGFRLPLELHQQLVERAERYGESPGEYVRRFITKTLTAASSTVVTPRHAVLVPEGCAHAKRTGIGGGMLLCDSCKAIRGADNIWRHPG
jgi:hypothetical protein